MTAKEYKEKANEILQEYIKEKNKINPNEFATIERCCELEDEFLHLVFFFNPNMPMLDEMKSNSLKYRCNVIKYIERFIHYLNEYCQNE